MLTAFLLLLLLLGQLSQTRTASLPSLLQQDIATLESLYLATNGTSWARDNVIPLPQQWLTNGNIHAPLDRVISNVFPWDFSRNASTGNYLHSPCTEKWYGIACDATSSFVTQLIVAFIGPGVLPSQLFDGLPRLKVFFVNCLFMDGLIATNKMGSCTFQEPPPRGGILPPNFGRAWPDLENLSLMFTMVTGSFADLGGIKDMPRLKQVTITGHFISDLDALVESLASKADLKILDLGSCYVTLGTIPSSIGLLSTLLMFGVWNTNIIGTIPTQMGALTRLNVLDLGNNKISGPIPPSLAALRRLEYFNLGNNFVTGTFPAFWALLGDLQGLDLHNNLLGSRYSSQEAQSHLMDCPQFDGLVSTIPSSLARLTKLKILCIDSNYLTGGFEAVSALTNLEYCYVHDNCLTGPLPPLAALTNLRALYLGNNSFTGPIRLRDINKLTNLTIFSVSGNKLTGRIPSAIGGLLVLQELDLSNNLLTGRVPPELSLLRHLLVLNVGSNDLTSTLPWQLSRLTSLRTLIVSNNSFIDTGDFAFINITAQPDLQLVDLTRNIFDSTLPLQLFSLPSLTFFYASSNCFHGSLDGEAICRATRLQKLVLDGLGSADECLVPYFPSLKPGNEDDQIDDSTDDQAEHAPRLQFLFNGLHSKKLMTGSIPGCIFNLPRLQTLQIAGNGLTGRIPEEGLNLSASLSKIVLSHNRLSNSIPSALLRSLDRYEVIDLGYNRFRGTLDAVEVAPSSSLTLRINGNRLSGEIPAALSQLTKATLNVLDGNHFSCPSDVSNALLPNTDPYSVSYQCGSMQMDRYFAMFWSLCGLCAVYYVLAGRWGWHGSAWYSSSLVKSDAIYPFLRVLFDAAPIAASVARLRLWLGASGSPAPGRPTRPSSHTLQLNSPVVARFFAALDDLKLYSIAMLLLMLLVLIPLYGALSVFQSDFSFEYSYAVSAAFKHGLPATYSLFAVWWVLVLGNTYIFTVIFGHTDVVQQSEVALVYTARVRNGAMAIRHRATLTFTALQREFLKHRAETIDDGAYVLVRLRLLLRLVIITFTNLFVSLVVNIAFVFLINLETTSKNEQLVLKVMLAGYKVLSNWTLIPWTLSLRSLQLGLPRKLVDEGGLFRGGDVFQVLLVSFNFILAPCMALILADSSCFKNIIDEPPGVASAYRVQSTILYAYFKMKENQQTGEVSLSLPKHDPEPHINYFRNSYRPTFIYQYRCSSTVIVLFAPVFMLSCIISTFGPILKNWIWRAAIDWCAARLRDGGDRQVAPGGPVDSVDVIPASMDPSAPRPSDPSPPLQRPFPHDGPALSSRLLARLRCVLLHTLPKSFLSSSERRERDRENVESALRHKNVRTFEEVHDSIINARHFFQQLLLDFVLLLTFGITCPLLGLTVCACLAFRVARWRCMLSGLLRQVGVEEAAQTEGGSENHSGDSNDTATCVTGAGAELPPAPPSLNLAEELTLVECDILTATGGEKNTHPLYTSRWLILLLSTFFYAPFLVDTSGDDAWAALAFIGACLLPFALRKLVRRGRGRASAHDAAVKTSTAVTIEGAIVVDNPIKNRGSKHTSGPPSGELELSAL